jgi:phosphoribosyl 1,2-cyclic phosphodiesterase
MIVRVLGCSGGVGKGLRTTSYLLDEHILLDGGTGVGDLTLDEMRQIRHLVLTHAHLDHIAGFALMLSSIYDSFQHTI